MKRPIYCAGLILGVLGLASTGCQHPGPTGTVSKPTSGDPTAWSDKELTKGSSDSDSSPGMPKSSALQGTWSPEARDIERSLGVTK
jgi:hypothetical protein